MNIKNTLGAATAILVASVLLTPLSFGQITLKPGGSLWIEGDSTLKRWSSTSTAVELSFTFAEGVSDPAEAVKASKVKGLEARIPVASLKSGDKGLDKNMYKAMNADKFPEVLYKLGSYEPVKTGAGGVMTAQTTGELTIAGRTKTMTMDLECAPGQDGLHLRGAHTLNMSDYGIAPPQADARHDQGPRPGYGSLRSHSKYEQGETPMNRAMTVLMTAALVAGLSSSALALEVVRNDKLKLDIHGRGQMIGVGQVGVPDPYRDNARIYLFMKQARLGFKGSYEDIKFETQFSFGGENTNGSNTDLGMLDFVADIPVKPLGEDTKVKVGQFRVPYGREGITDRGYMNFAERSIATMASYQTRDYGLALQRHSGKLAATMGLFSGGGRNVPQRYLPEVLGIPQVVARVGYNDGVDEDIYHVVGTDIDLTRTTKAAYVNALFMKDTLIGHAVVQNLRTIDKNLLIDSNYNPFIAAGPNNSSGTIGGANTLQRGRTWFVGGDAVLRHPLTNGHLIETEAQVDWGGFENRYGSIHILSARAQMAYHVKPYQIGVRWAGLMLDKNAGFITPGAKINPTMGSVIHEVTPSWTWHIKKHNLKLVADAPVYLNMPVFIEKGVGAYMFSSQPEQVRLLRTAGHTVVRRTVVEGRMMLQFMF